MGRGFHTPLDARNQRWFTTWLLLAALVLSFGCGLIFCQLDPLLERLGAPRLGAGATGVVMMVAWGLGASRQTVNAIETGRFDPSLPLAFRLARLFGRALEEIFEPGEES